MSNKLLLVLFVMFVANINAQIETSFSGYFVDMPVYAYSLDKKPSFIPQEDQLLNLARLRLRPQFFMLGCEN